MNLIISSKFSLLFIFYVPKTDGDELTKTQIDKFKRDYSSHYITSDIIAVSGIRCRIECHLFLVVTNNIELNTTYSFSLTITL